MGDHSHSMPLDPAVNLLFSLSLDRRRHRRHLCFPPLVHLSHRSESSAMTTAAISRVLSGTARAIVDGGCTS